MRNYFANKDLYYVDMSTAVTSFHDFALAEHERMKERIAFGTVDQETHGLLLKCAAAGLIR